MDKQTDMADKKGWRKSSLQEGARILLIQRTITTDIGERSICSRGGY